MSGTYMSLIMAMAIASAVAARTYLAYRHDVRETQRVVAVCQAQHLLQARILKELAK